MFNSVKFCSLAWNNWFLDLQRSSSIFKMLSVSLATGVFLVIISALGQLGLPYLSKGGTYRVEGGSLPSSEVDYALNMSLDATEVFMHFKHCIF